MTSFSHALEVAAALSEEERLRLVDALLNSLAPADAAPLNDVWLAEISRRSELYDADGIATTTWDEVRDRVRRRVEERARDND